MLPTFTYVRPTSLDEAIKHLAAPAARVHAGGTDLVGCLREGLMHVDTIVSLGRLAELRGIGPAADGGVRIGALTTLSDIAASPELAETHTALVQAAASVGTPQLRNQGTLGGNLCQRPRCWYFRGDYACARKGGETCFALDGENQYHAIFGGGDGCCMVHPSDAAAALVALAARLRAVGPRGARSMPIEEFFVLPEKNLQKEHVLEAGEIVTEISLPAGDGRLRSSYRKVRTRAAWDFAVAGVALALVYKGDRVEQARIALAAAAPIPWRAMEAEQVLTGRRLDATRAARAAEAAVHAAVPLAKNGYKVSLFRGLVEEALLALARG